MRKGEQPVPRLLHSAPGKLVSTCSNDVHVQAAQTCECLGALDGQQRLCGTWQATTRYGLHGSGALVALQLSLALRVAIAIAFARGARSRS